MRYGVVEDGVGGVEDVPLSDGVVGVVGAEFLKRDGRNVFAAAGAVMVVDVVGEALGIPRDVEVHQIRYCKHMERA